MIKPVVWYSDVTNELYTSEERAKYEDSVLDSNSVVRLTESYKQDECESLNKTNPVVVSVRKILNHKS